MNGNMKLMFDDRVAWQNFCQSSVDKQNVDKHDNDKRSVLHLWHHQVRSIQDDPVHTSMSSPPSEISLSTEPCDKSILCSCFLLLTLGGISKLLFATIIEWSCNSSIHQRLHRMVICTETKSDILQCLLGDIPVSHTSPDTTATVLDDAVIVQMLSPLCGNATTFPYYAESVLIPHLSGFCRING